MKSESEIQQQIQMEAASHNCILMRNNSGAFTDGSGRHVRYGLDNTSKKRNEIIKSSDLIGITPIVITQAMVGLTIGVFTAVEVKKEDWNPNKKLDAHEQAQKNWIDWVRSRGGLADFINSVEQLKLLILR